MILSITIAVLTAGGVYLMLQRSMVRTVFGLTLLSHAANFTLLAAGVGAWRGEPIDGRTAVDLAADPLPQAFVLTAIVISLAVTIFMLALAVLGHDDDQYRTPETGEGHEQ
ncbi:sodium:proton antiporter [Brevibacterium litoralis]|uniref:sodium:proton antiporter n=1 Tax=Brevibacterium litoralis TaxID=3138935 RepID=UPI0032EEF7D9